MVESREHAALRRHVLGAVAAAQRAAGESIEVVLYRGWNAPLGSSVVAAPPPGAGQVLSLQRAALYFRDEALAALAGPDPKASLMLVPEIIKAFYSRVEYDDGVRWSRHWIAWRRVQPPPLDGNLEAWADNPDVPSGSRSLAIDTIQAVTGGGS